MSKILIIDSHSLIHRAYHALPKEIMSKGKHTNAVYGFTRMILKLITTEKPDYLFVAHDAPGPTFRTDMADTYKATRKPTHDDLIEQSIRLPPRSEFTLPAGEKIGCEGGAPSVPAPPDRQERILPDGGAPARPGRQPASKTRMLKDIAGIVNDSIRA